jgi:hypothetical protein
VDLNKVRFEKTKEVAIKIYEFMEAAIKKNQKIWIALE